MSKLLDLLAQQNAIAEQQNAIAEQIKTLQADEKEAKVLKFVEELEALREKHGYNVADFIDVVHSLHNVKTAAKNVKSVSVKTTKAKAPKFKVVIDGVETILQSKKAGAVGAKIEKLGFSTYADYLADLMKKNDVNSFDVLIEKLGGVPVTA
ncbi:hypothetical protein M2399_002583 [Pseudomonas sp. BIGb0450]|uniref:hypothetical protein n=1 Tax=unclassified Pseudomonas TaxID=196821 RepID=UPI002169F2C1|nr:MULTISPECIES: hypothetical protein [unclassified Pseudomonas]MCS3417147.1 hypothetical protein [Pseudomonas sp. BIGb0558]MCS3437146.1 hypothetical protein [Pseudomonas sp. BIGb0450]